MEVTIHVIQRKTGGSEFSKLRLQFSFNLLSQPLLKKITESGRNWIIRELPLFVDQSRNFVMAESAVPANKSEVQPYTEPRICPGHFHSRLECVFIHHQARGGQKPAPMRLDDCLVNAFRAAKIVRVED